MKPKAIAVCLILLLAISRRLPAQTESVSAGPHLVGYSSFGFVGLPSFAFVAGFRVARKTSTSELPMVSLDLAYAGDLTLLLLGLGANALRSQRFAGASIVHVSGDESESGIKLAVYAGFFTDWGFRLEARYPLPPIRY